MQKQKRDYFRNTPVAALATATGGAIALVRVSGMSLTGRFREFCPELEERCFARPRYAARVTLYENEKPFEEAVATFYKGPASFTGEDVLELAIHGSALGAKRVLKLLFQAGCEQALPGEFSFRAVRNGKITVPQAEGVKELVEATTVTAMNLAYEKSQGLTQRVSGRILEQLKEILALSEVGMDFSDQDLPETGLRALKLMLKPALSELIQLEQTYDRSARAEKGVRVLLVGQPNAGKSSLFNALLGSDRAIVSETPGTTRDLVSEALELTNERGQTVLFRFADAAGLRITGDSIESVGVQKVLGEIPNSDAILWVRDVALLSQGPTEVESHAIETARQRKIPILEIHTKSDLLSLAQDKSASAEIARAAAKGVLSVSSVTGAGIRGLISKMVDLFANDLERKTGELWITSLDQARAIRAGIHELKIAELAENEAVFAFQVKAGLHEMRQALGAVSPDDVLSVVFERFCIGK